MSVEQMKTIKIACDQQSLAGTRQVIVTTAATFDLRIVAIEQKGGRLSTTLVVTVAGHPRHIREFRDEFRTGSVFDGAAGGIDFTDTIVGLAVSFVYDVFLADQVKAARRKWRGRHDPPLEEARDSPPAQGDPRTPPGV